MLKMFDDFPRQLGFPERYLVENMKEMLNLVNKYNGKKRVFASLYNYTGNLEFDKLNLNLDKIWFDLDSDKCLDNVLKLHVWCMKEKYRHVMFFSGKGFHFYIFTKNYKKVSDKRQTLKNVQQHVAKIVGLTIGNPKIADIDEHIIGDIARIVTFPNTFNTKRRRYCINITEEMLKKGYDFIKERAKKQNKRIVFYGKKNLEIDLFDKKEDLVNSESIVAKVPDSLMKTINSDAVLKNLPLCIKFWLYQSKANKKKLGWTKRGWLYYWLRDYGIWRKEIDEPMPCILSETIAIAKHYFTEAEFIHSCTNKIAPGYSEKGEEQPQYLYRQYVRERHSFPSCETIKAQGECPIKGKCKERGLFRKKLGLIR